MAKNPFTGKENGRTVEIPVSELKETIEQQAQVLVDTGQMAMPGMDDEDGEADELRALAEIDGGGDCTFQVWRQLPATAKGFVGQLAAAELTVQKVQEEWGPGRYRVRGLRSNGTYAGQRTIDIAVAAKGPPQPSPTPQNNFTDMLALMEAKDRERSGQMKEWALILVPALAPIIANMVGNKGPSLNDLTQTLVNMKALNGGDKNESQISKIEELAKMVDIIKGIGGDDKATAGSTWVDLIRDGVKEIGPALTGFMASKVPSPGSPSISIAASPVQIPSTPVLQQSPGDPMMALLGWLKEQLAGLAHQARLNKDPSLYAEVVLDNMPEGVDPKILRQYLGNEKWWPMLVQFMPTVQPYPQWFAECRTELLRGLDDMIASVEPQAQNSPPVRTSRGPLVNAVAPMPNDVTHPGTQDE